MRRGGRIGFTLIELLVVIAVISLIAGLLFPVFAQAREKARQAKCLSNLRQLAIGMLMYAEDHDELLPPVLIGDRDRLRQVLLNLLGNALKFTERGGVTLRVRRQREHFDPVGVRFEVIDTGVGIAAEAVPTLFERFTLGDTSTLRGWNKYDIAPAGGDRMFHQSLEFRLWHVGAFFDVGSVWDRSSEAKTRYSTGFGAHSDNGFLTFAFPLNTDNGGGLTFMAGVRF